jgi:hypothetical protein
MRQDPTIRAALPALAFGLLACSLLTTQTPVSPTATPAAPGSTVTYNNVSFTLPEGLGTGAAEEMTVEVDLPFINPSFGDMPTHHKFVIQGYPDTGSDLTPRILVFNAAEFAAYSELTHDMIADLQASKGHAETLPDGILLVSDFYGSTKFFVGFQNGYGWAYLTQIGQAPLPINNAELFYYFQGLTNDGKYYVSAILPTSAPFVVADSNPGSVFPADAVPFDWNDPGNASKYYEAVAQQLNSALPEAFFPDLSKLEALIQSVSVSP